jgi:hypothetical protein
VTRGMHGLLRRLPPASGLLGILLALVAVLWQVAWLDRPGPRLQAVAQAGAAIGHPVVLSPRIEAARPELPDRAPPPAPDDIALSVPPWAPAAHGASLPDDAPANPVIGSAPRHVGARGPPPGS